MSLSKAQQSRLNGAKSHGPKTPEGKARSSMNAVKHGRYANNAIVLSNEDALAFEALVDQYVKRVQPADPIEYNCARELASIDWRLARTRALSTRLLDHEMELQMLALETSGHHPEELTRLLHASRSTFERSGYPAFLLRCESQLLHARLQAFRALRALRKDVPLADPALEIIPPLPIDPDSFFPNDLGTNLVPGGPGLQCEPDSLCGSDFPSGAGFQSARDSQSRPQDSRESSTLVSPQASFEPSIQPRPQASTRTGLKPHRRPESNTSRHSTPSPSAPTLAAGLAPGLALGLVPNDPVELPVKQHSSSGFACSPAPSEKAA